MADITSVVIWVGFFLTWLYVGMCIREMLR